MKQVQATGYTKEKALASTGLEIQLTDLTNATQMWKKDGSPTGTKALNAWVENYLKKNKKIGAYIVVASSSDDTRTRPYQIINEITDGKRKALTSYQIKEAEFVTKTKKVIVPEKQEDGTEVEVEKEITYVDEKSIVTGAVAYKAKTKAEALKIMKEAIAIENRDFAVEIVKEIVEGKKYAAFGKYTPSAAAKEGSFIFFVRE